MPPPRSARRRPRRAGRAARRSLRVAFALQAPQWVCFRRMDYPRLRLLQGLLPLVTVVVTVPLLLAGVGVWALVIGPLCGNAAAVVAAAKASPYPLRPRLERDA